MEIDLQKNLHYDLSANLKNKIYHFFCDEIRESMDSQLVARLEYEVILDFFPVDYLVSNFISRSVIGRFSKEKEV